MPISNNIKHDRVNMTRDQSKFSIWYGHYLQALKDIAGDKFYIVRANIKNVETTTSSWDNPGEFNFKDHPMLKHAVSFFNNEYGLYMSDCIASDEEISSEMNWTTSPGIPATLFGFKKRSELVNDVEYNKWMASLDYDEEIPIYSATPKVEFKEKADIVCDKIRLFQIPPHHLLRSQIKFGKRISLRMKGLKWSAYGFNPYNGGVALLAERLLSKRLRLMYDVSGWDKFLPILRWVYEVIRRNCGYYVWSPEVQREFNWTVYYTINHILRLFDGDVVMKCYGNPSGSGTTTRDNIFAHIIIFSMILFDCYYRKYGEVCDPVLIAQQVVYLFGDDNVASLDLEFDYILTPNYLEDFFKMFGMKLKFLVIGLDLPLEKLGFLGFMFKKKNGTYYPLYDVSRLATSMVYNAPDNNTRETFLTKAFVLCFMSYASEHFTTFARAYRTMVKNFPTQNNTETELFFMHAASDLEKIIEGIYLGFEANLDRFSFFIDHWMEVGIN